MKKIALLVCSLYSCLFASTHQQEAPELANQQLSLLLIDTNGHDQYAYRNLILLAEAVGFRVDYRNFYGLLENNQIASYDAVFLLPALACFKILKTRSSKIA